MAAGDAPVSIGFYVLVSPSRCFSERERSTRPSVILASFGYGTKAAREKMYCLLRKGVLYI